MALRGFTYLPYHGFRWDGDNGVERFYLLYHDRVLVDTSRSANFARRAFTTAVFCSLPAAAAVTLPRMAAKANMMLVNFIFRLKRDWGM